MVLDKKALIELAKTFARFIWFGVLGLIVVFLTSLGTSADLINAHFTLFGTSFSLGFAIVAVVMFVAKAIDRYVHKNENISWNGIALPFLQK